MTPQSIDQQCINTIRILSMDVVQRANSGHPGTAMAMAPVAYYLWQHFLRTDLAFSEDVAARFMAYGWHMTCVGDANDLAMLDQALSLFQETEDRPMLIIADSYIAYRAPHKQDSSVAHGAPLGEEEIRLAKCQYGWPEDSQFLVLAGCRNIFRPSWT